MKIGRKGRAWPGGLVAEVRLVVMAVSVVVVGLVAVAGFGLAQPAFAAGTGGGGGVVDGREARPFPMVKIPDNITERAAAAEFLAEHFWDDFVDTTNIFSGDHTRSGSSGRPTGNLGLVNGVAVGDLEQAVAPGLVNGVAPGDLEQAVADWTGLLNALPRQVAERAVVKMFRRLSGYETVLALIERYLYDPDSPMKNEALFGLLASYMASHEGYSPEQRLRYESIARLCALNKAGTRAADFEFSDRAGHTRRLYSIDAAFTLLLFSSSGCGTCQSLIESLSADSLLNQLIETGDLAVVNVCISDDFSAWRSSAAAYPQHWLNCFDHNQVIRSEMLYNVRSTPSLYLLGSDKTVILKDAPVPVVLAYIARLNQ